MKNNQIKILLLGLAFFAFVILANAGVAEAKRAIILSPTGQKILLIPGETYHGAFKVTNPNDANENLDYVVNVGSYSIKRGNGSKDDYGEADIESVTDYNEIMDWIKIDSSTGTLAPNQEGTVAFSINVPSDAPAGGQYATLLVKDTTPNHASGSINISEKLQMAHVIYAEVAGETRKTGAVTENNFPSFLTSSKLEATSMVKNTGNTHTDASYMLQVWPMFSDEEICTNEEKTESSLILPNTERYHVQTCELPTVGIFRAKQVVKIFGEESTLEKTIIVCPIWLMILILMITIAIIVAIVIFIRRGKNKKSTKHQTESKAE